MQKNSYPGKFIVFEGPDGSGQSTQSDLLAKYLTKVFKKKGKEKRSGVHYTGVHITKEPSSGVIGGFIREALKERWKQGPMFGPMLMQCLFVADRAHHLEHEVIPALEQGKIVICDRYAFSTIAYGAAEYPELWNCLSIMNDTFLEPDVTFILDVPAQICMTRIAETRDHSELYEKERMLKKVLANYKNLAARYPHVEIVDGAPSKRKVFDQIRVFVDKQLGFFNV